MKTTLTKRILIPVFSLALLLISLDTFTYSGGPPAAMTNAPGESNCTSCHTGTVITSGTDWDNISLTAALYAGSSTKYKITIDATKSLVTRYGFELCVLPSGAKAATASVGTLSTNLSTDMQVITSGKREYIEHTNTGIDFSGGAAKWEFDWTKPAAYSGTVVFYLSLNATNNNSSNSGDNIYVKTFSTVTMPVRWLSADAVKKDNQVLVQWSVASEVNNSHFEVERSANRTDWKTLGRVKGAVNSSTIRYYSYADFSDMNKQVVYYRVKQVDMSGHIDYSKTISIDLRNKQSDWVIYPNPVTQQLYIEPFDKGAIEAISIYTIGGELVSKEELAFKQDRYTVNTDQLNKGVYFISIKTENDFWQQKFVKE